MEIFNRFAKGVGSEKADPMVWGGKGAGLSKMAVKGYPVPPGFTISTELCKAYNAEGIGPEAVMDAIMLDVPEHLSWLEEQIGFMPLLSVRSGAPVSMPGMMDTILNVGLTSANIGEWEDRIGERAAWDSRRRLLQMMGSTALGIDHVYFEDALTLARKKAKVETDAELSTADLKKLFGAYRTIYQSAGHDVPDTLLDQLKCCINAVFGSWMNERAVTYRNLEGIDHAMGTAVTVQAMVFGNMNDKSGSGVLFTREPSTGEKKIMAEYLVNAQGEDVVAGIRTPEKLVFGKNPGKLSKSTWMGQLAELCVKLEEDYRDMVDAEFTVQDDVLFMLQSRVGKRSAQAAFKIALDLVDEGVITEDEMIARIKPKHYATLKRPAIDPKFKAKPLLTGIGASMGIAIGRAALSSEQAVKMAKEGPVILVTHETTPDDIAGMAASVGILTQTGGATSHAAVVARGMDKPCVVGCTEMQIGGDPSPLRIEAGMTISIDGETGRVWHGEVPVIGGELTEAARKVIDLMMVRKGVTEVSETPVPGGCVPLAAWMDCTDEQIEAMVKEAEGLLSSGWEVLFDLTEPTAYGDEADRALWDMCGEAPELQLFVDRVISKVLHADLSEARFIGGNTTIRSMFDLKGWKPLPVVKTVPELIAAEGMVTMSETLKMVMAGKTKDILDVHLSLAKPVEKMMPRGYAAFELLGAA